MLLSRKNQRQGLTRIVAEHVGNAFCNAHAFSRFLLFGVSRLNLKSIQRFKMLLMLLK